MKSKALLISLFAVMVLSQLTKEQQGVSNPEANSTVIFSMKEQDWQDLKTSIASISAIAVHKAGESLTDKQIQVILVNLKRFTDLTAQAVQNGHQVPNSAQDQSSPGWHKKKGPSENDCDKLRDSVKILRDSIDILSHK